MNYRYNLVTTRNGLTPVKDVKEGTEVLSSGKWVKAPKPVKGTVLECSFETLPTTCFEVGLTGQDKEVSICHQMILVKNENFKSELSIRGFFREDKKCVQTTFLGTDSITYWLPRFIRYYDEPMMPGITTIGFNLYHRSMEAHPLEPDEMNERNFEYILEGMNRRTFHHSFGKYGIFPVTSWNETHKLTMRVLDIECAVTKTGNTVVKNPVNFYRHIRDEYTKKKVKDEDIAFDLKRSNVLPPYTDGHRVVSCMECEEWYLPGVNPDVNGINPLPCGTTGFTSMNRIYTTETVNDSPRFTKPRMMHEGMYLHDNFFSLLTEGSVQEEG